MSESVLTIEDILQTVAGKFSGLVVNKNWGETGLFYNPELRLKKGIYLLTIKEKDGQNDSSSNLNRQGIYRLSVGISKSSFLDQFGHIPARPLAGQVIDMPYNFSGCNVVTPHPVYGWMAWVCVLNPSWKTFRSLMPLIKEGYCLAMSKYEKRTVKADPCVNRNQACSLYMDRERAMAGLGMG